MVIGRYISWAWKVWPPSSSKVESVVSGPIRLLTQARDSPLASTANNVYDMGTSVRVYGHRLSAEW